MAEKILHIIGQLTGSLDNLKTSEGDPDVSDGDMTEEKTALTNTDGRKYEIPEIDGSTSVISSVTPGRVPCKRDYETSKLVSSGHFGAVYLVQHKDTQQMFAMKKIDKQNLLKKPGSLERVFLERDVLAFSECPFIVSMISSFTTKHHLCMVMEYVGGGDCEALLLEWGALSVPLARMYFAETVLAIEYLHSHGIIHRDLKPDNLLITTSGHIKVTDFGLSKLGFMRSLANTYETPREDITKEFMDKETCGTPYYLAPEVILRIGYGRPIDWWSLGVILYRFLTGSVPFDGTDRQDFYDSIVYDDIPWDCYLDPDAMDIITELLIKDPEYRLGTGGANEVKLHPFLKDLDFNSILSQRPEYVPQIASDTDTSCFVTRGERYHHMVSEEEEDTSEDGHCQVFENFVSSTLRLKKLYNTMVNDEDPEPSPKDSTGDISEKRSEDRAEKSSEERAEESPEDRAEKRSEDRAEKRSEDRAEEKRSDDRAEEKNSEDRAEKKSDDRAEKRSEDRVEKKSEDRAEKRSDDRAEKRSEDRAEKRSEDRAEKRSEDRVEKKSEDRAEERSEDRAEERSDDRAEERSEDRAEKRSEDRAERRSDDRADKRSDDRAEERSDDRAEERSEDRAEETSADNTIHIAVDNMEDKALESTVDNAVDIVISDSDNQQLSASNNATSEVSAPVIGRWLSSCRRRLSRAARAIRRHCLFGCCHPISRSPSRQASSSSSWGEGIEKPWSGIPHCPSTVV